MNRSPALLATKLSGIFEILDEKGIGRDTFLSAINIDTTLFNSHESKLTVTQVVALLEKAKQVTGNGDIGLLLGQKSRFLPNIVCYIMMNCLTVGDALTKYSQYKRIFSDETNIQITNNTDTAMLTMNSTAPELSALRLFTDYKLTTIYIFINFLTGGKLKLNRITVTHDRPDNLSGYKKVFTCPIEFSHQSNTMLFSSDAFNLPVVCPNRNLLDHFEEYAREILDRISTEDTISKNVGRILIKILQSGGTPSVKLIAEQTNMSVRKLQGLLEKESTTYKKLLYSVRKKLAVAYLNDNQMSLTEVSYLLGFSEPSAFHRAFRNWTGSTPGQFRSAQKYHS